MLNEMNKDGGDSICGKWVSWDTSYACAFLYVHILFFFFPSLVAENEYRWTVTSEKRRRASQERWMGGLFM